MLISSSLSHYIVYLFARGKLVSQSKCGGKNLKYTHRAGDLWSRFVTEFPEDQDLLSKESFSRFKFRPIVTNYSGNTQDVIRHRLGDASNFSQSVFLLNAFFWRC